MLTERFAIVFIDEFICFTGFGPNAIATAPLSGVHLIVTFSKHPNQQTTMHTLLTIALSVALASFFSITAQAQTAPVKDFAVELGQAQLSLVGGSTAQASVKVVRGKGWAKNKIELKLSHSIPGVTATVESGSGPDEYTVKLVAGAGATPGKYSLTVTGRNVSVSHGSVIMVDVTK